MGSVSDRSNPRVFLSAGLILSAAVMLFMGFVPWATSSIAVMFVLLFFVGPDYHMLIADSLTPKEIVLTDMAEQAHSNKLKLHPYTLRADALPSYVIDVNQLYNIIYEKAKAEGAFTDFHDKGVDFLQQQGQHK